MEEYNYTCDQWPIVRHDDFYEDDMENPDQYWRHKETNILYKVIVDGKWSWWHFKYIYMVKLLPTNINNNI